MRGPVAMMGVWTRGLREGLPFPVLRMRRWTRRLCLRRWPRPCVYFGRLSTDELGQAGETWVSHRLQRAGWKILGRRVSTPFAEVDLIARYGSRIALLEVKSGRLSGPLAEPGRIAKDLCARGTNRGTAPWRPGLHFGPKQRRAYGRAKGLLARSYPQAQLAVDLVEVIWFAGRWQPILIHHRDVYHLEWN